MSTRAGLLERKKRPSTHPCNWRSIHVSRRPRTDPAARPDRPCSRPRPDVARPQGCAAPPPAYYPPAVSYYYTPPAVSYYCRRRPCPTTRRRPCRITRRRRCPITPRRPCRITRRRTLPQRSRPATGCSDAPESPWRSITLRNARPRRASACHAEKAPGARIPRPRGVSFRRGRRRRVIRSLEHCLATP